MIKNSCKIFFCALIMIISLHISAMAEGIYTFGDVKIAQTKINVQKIKGENVLVMPSSASPGKFILFGDFTEESEIFVKNGSVSTKFSSGMEMKLNKPEEDEFFLLELTDKKGFIEDFSVKIYFSENVPSVYLVSDNPAEKGRLWVEESVDKSNKATGFMVMQKNSGETVFSGNLTQIKGRGNSTWSQIKKPYQIKTADKVDLLQTGNDENKSKTWVLLANYLDSSLLNNSIILGLGRDMGMKTNVENTHVDLYYDGEYRGSYLLSEKVEIGSGRVAITDLEKINEELNDGKEDYPIKTAVTANGAEYTYCEGMVSPEDVTGGYLIEMDYEVRAKEEICYFKTTRGQYVVVKSPELASKEEMDYIASLYQDYEDAVYNGGVNPATGKTYFDYVDRDSVAVYYLLNEFSKARDFFSSSAYLYKNNGDDKLHMGPLWDYDLGFTRTRFDSDGEETPYGLSIYNTEFGAKLFGIEDFGELLKKMYSEKLLPLTKNLDKNNAIKASHDINSMIWHNGEKMEDEADILFDFMKKRIEYLDVLFSIPPEERSGDIRFIDVFPTKWYYESVNTVEKLGFMNGVNELCFDPYSSVRRSEAMQVLFNMAGAEKPEYKPVFEDVKADDWFSDAVIWSAERNIMGDMQDGKFMPSENITREELVCAIYRYKNSPEAKENMIVNFRDGEKVSPTSINALNWAISEGIIVGDDNNCLNPQNNLTRAELAAILTRIK